MGSPGRRLVSLPIVDSRRLRALLPLPTTILAQLGCSCLLPLLEALAAKNWSALCRPEGYGSFFAALRTNRSGLDPVVGVALGWCGSQHGHPFRFAGFAPFWFILELLVTEEELFSRREDEVRAAVNTFQHLVLKFH